MRATLQLPPPWHRALERRFNSHERNLAEEKNEIWKEIYSISTKVDEHVDNMSNSSVEIKGSPVLIADESTDRAQKIDKCDVEALVKGFKDEKEHVRYFITKVEQQRKRTQNDLHDRMENMEKRISEQIVEGNNFMSSQLADIWNNTHHVREMTENLETVVIQVQTEVSGLKEKLTKLQPNCGTSKAFNGSCYFISLKLLTWEDARDSCHTYGAYLAEVGSEEEAGFLISLAKSARNVKGGFGPWLGASDTKSEGDLVWQFSGRRANEGFLDWVWNEPNGGRSENCLHMNNNAHLFQWNDIICTLKTNFIC